MKKILFIFLALIFLISGCNGASYDPNKVIVPPGYQKLPIEGKWGIENSYSNDSTYLLNNSDSKVSYAQFSNDGILFDTSFWENPSYTAKTAYSNDIISRYKAVSGHIEKNKKVTILTVTIQNNYLFEMVLLSKTEILAVFPDKIYLLRQISNQVDENFKNELKSSKNVKQQEIIENQNLDSGLLFGISSSNGNKTSYKTVWMNFHNYNLSSIMQRQGIILPRKSGFWTLDVKRKTIGSLEIDSIEAIENTNYDSAPSASHSESTVAYSGFKGNIKKSITYVGNDYISFKSDFSLFDKTRNINLQYEYLTTKIIDTLSNAEPLKYTDIFNDSNKQDNTTIKGLINDQLDQNGFQNASRKIDETNFGLFRKTGHWYFKARFQYSPLQPDGYVDILLNVPVPDKVVKYDVLYVPWSNVKDKHPDAIDVFTSPNKDIALIVTHDKIYIYPIYDRRLGEHCIKTIQLKKGDSIIMSEWARGNYVHFWQNAMQRFGATNYVDN